MRWREIVENRFVVLILIIVLMFNFSAMFFTIFFTMFSESCACWAIDCVFGWVHYCCGAGGAGGEGGVAFWVIFGVASWVASWVTSWMTSWVASWVISRVTSWVVDCIDDEGLSLAFNAFNVMSIFWNSTIIWANITSINMISTGLVKKSICDSIRWYRYTV